MYPSGTDDRDNAEKLSTSDQYGYGGSSDARIIDRHIRCDIPFDQTVPCAKFHLLARAEVQSCVARQKHMSRSAQIQFLALVLRPSPFQSIVESLSRERRECLACEWAESF